MKLGVTLDILNQKATPAFYADTLANRPAAGYTGRVFISTDTYDLYRDTGTTWVLLSPSSTGTITGSGAAGQVTYFSGTSSITGNNNLFWDSTNFHLGIQTITPDCALDVNHNGTFVAKFNNTSSANTLIGIYNADNPQWLIGSNNVANNLTFYDATNFPTLVATTTMKTDGTTYIGGQTTGSGRLNVYSATSDNGIQISGANAPSLRIDNAPTGATKRIGLGIATAVNNFIQGAVDRDMCIFNGSTTASPILFGIYDTTNVQEAARISAARNFLIGTTTDAGQKLQVSGTALITGATTFNSSISATSANAALYRIVLNTNAGYSIPGTIGYNSNDGNYIWAKAGTSSNFTILNDSGSSVLTLASTGNLGLGITPNSWTGTNTKAFQFGVSGALGNSQTFGTILFNNSYYDSGYKYISSNSASAYVQDGNTHLWYNAPSGTAGNAISFTQAMTLSGSTGNLLIGTTTDNGKKLQVNGGIYSTYLSPQYNATNGNGGGYLQFQGIENSVVTLSTLFPNVTFTSNAITLRLQLVMYNGTATQASSCIINCIRNGGGTWTYNVVSNVADSVGGGFTPTLTFGGTNANPTLQITGANNITASFELMAR